MKATHTTLLSLLVACGSSDPQRTIATSPVAPHAQVVSASGGPLVMVAGDALPLKIVMSGADGGTSELPAGTTTSWSTPIVYRALPPGTVSTPLISAASALAGSPPTVAFFANPSRPTNDDALGTVLFALDPGTLQNGQVEIVAKLDGAMTGEVHAIVTVNPAPFGDAVHGASVYKANCARCHGDHGEGSPPSTDGKTFVIDGKPWPFPAPPLSASAGGVAGDPQWSAALMSMAARADLDNHGVSLRAPMPDWMFHPPSGTAPTTSDYADIFRYLTSQ